MSVDLRPISEYEIKPPMMGNASPILVFGILIFIMPYFQHFIKLPFPGFFTWFGLFLMVVGIIHSGIKMSNR